MLPALTDDLAQVALTTGKRHGRAMTPRAIQREQALSIRGDQEIQQRDALFLAHHFRPLRHADIGVRRVSRPLIQHVSQLEWITGHQIGRSVTLCYSIA